MQANVSTRLDGDDSNRTLNDYVDLGGIDKLQLDSEEDDIEHFDDIDDLDDANQAAIEQGMALRIQPPAPKATTFYFAEGDDWKRQLAGHKISTSVRAGHVRATVKSAIPENDLAGGGGVKAVDASTVETCPEPEVLR